MYNKYQNDINKKTNDFENSKICDIEIQTNLNNANYILS